MRRIQNLRRGAGYALVAVVVACSSSSDPPETTGGGRDASNGQGGSSVNTGGGGSNNPQPTGGAGGATGGGAVEPTPDASDRGGSGGAGGSGSAGAGAGGGGASGGGGAAGSPPRSEAGVVPESGVSSPARDAAAEARPPALDAGGPGIDLFNGTDLTGWDISTTWPPALSTRAPLTAAEAQRVFKVENGMIHDYADAVDGSEQVRATLTTVASYSRYKLTLEYRWGTKKFAPYAALARDAGILFHVTGDRAKVWPDSTEFQIKEAETGDIFALGQRCTSLARAGGDTFLDAPEGGVSKLIDGTGGNAQHKHLGAFEVPDWNTVELDVTDDAAVYFVNGHLVNKVFTIQDRTGRRVTSGPIVLQAEHAEVFYRNVRLQVLP